MRESEIHFARWICNKPKNNTLIYLVVSIVLHVVLCLFMMHSKPINLISADEPKPSIRIHLSKSKQNSKVKHDVFIPKKEKQILTQSNSTSNTQIYESSQHKKKSELKKQVAKSDDVKSILPNSNIGFLNELRAPSATPDNEVNANEGNELPTDVDSLAPSNSPRILSRYVEKDMSLYQFNQEFKDKFGAIWNSQDRIVPPNSPFHPGDKIIYKIVVNSNGKLVKYTNLSRIQNPKMDYSGIDSMISEVIERVLPIKVPPKFANKNFTISENIAIQIVDRNSPFQLSL